MAKIDKDNMNSAVVSEKDKKIDKIVFVALCLGAVIMVFPLIYCSLQNCYADNKNILHLLRSLFSLPLH